MKKQLFLNFSLLLLIFFIFPYIALAEDTSCTQGEKMRLRQLAALAKVSYERLDCTDEYGASYMAYKINISGFTNDFYVYQSQNGALFEYQNDAVASSFCFLPGETIELPFYASKNSACSGYLILMRTVALPPYNKFSEDPLCIGYEDYELCKKNSPIVISSYEEFVSRMNQYIKNIKEKPTEENNNDTGSVNNTIWDNIIIFLTDNVLYITIPIILTGTTVIVIIEIKNRRSIL